MTPFWRAMPRRGLWATTAIGLGLVVGAGLVAGGLLLGRPSADRRLDAVGKGPAPAQSFLRAQPGPAASGTEPIVYALQPQIALPEERERLIDAPLRLQPGPGGSAPITMDRFAARPVMAEQPVALGAVRLALSVASGVLALLGVIQLGRLAFANWRGELLSARHGLGLRRLAWFALTIGLTHLSTIGWRIGMGLPRAGVTLADAGPASAAVLASLFLFFFAHAVSEGAKLADEHLYTV